MTIDPIFYSEKHTFVKPKPKAFFPAEILNHHKQLKNHISTADDGFIYFTSNQEIHVINLATHRCERLAVLKFRPTCLGAGHGWVCAGGFGEGKCVFIDVRACMRGPSLQDVDTLMPLDLDELDNIRMRNVELEAPDSSPWRAARAHRRDIGDEIVNAITVHKLRCPEEPNLRDEEVAILANNDDTVHIYSLTRLDVLDILEYPTHTNYATLSPDGTLLVAIGDEARVFFHRRRRLAFPSQSTEQPYAEWAWDEVVNIRLTVTHILDPCFAAAFSSSGAMLAIGSQCGFVTVFDVNRIRSGMEDDEAVIDAFISSRPCPITDNDTPGAVRSLAFAPGPWDLLAWAEDQGRFCIVDLRTGFRARQTVSIDLTSMEDRTITLNGIGSRSPRSGTTRYQGDAYGASSVRQGADLIERNALVRRHEGTEMGNELPSNLLDLSDGERHVYDVLRSETARENSRPERPFSVRYINEVMTRSANNQDSRAPSYRSTPRRRESVILSETQNNRSAGDSNLSVAPTQSLSASPQPIATDSVSPRNTALHRSDSRRATNEEPTQRIDTWRDFQDIRRRVEAVARVTHVSHAEAARIVAASELDPDAARDASGVPQYLRRQPFRSLQAQQLALMQMERDRRRATAVTTDTSLDDPALDPYSVSLARRRAERSRAGDAVEPVVQGIQWSHDGRSLFVAVEAGILQYTVDIADRMHFPAIKPL